MRFNEINLFGLLCGADRGHPRRRLDHLPRVCGERAIAIGLTEQVWHPALFDLALYVIIVSSIVLVVARWGS